MTHREQLGQVLDALKIGWTETGGTGLGPDGEASTFIMDVLPNVAFKFSDQGALLCVKLIEEDEECPECGAWTPLSQHATHVATHHNEEER